MQGEVLSVRGRSSVGRLAAGLALLCLFFDAAATGWPPFAQPDSITVERGRTADQLDSGNYSVLDNDFDFERDPLTAKLEKKPKRGELELRADGTFLYSHDGSAEDTDHFEYIALDGTGESNPSGGEAQPLTEAEAMRIQSRPTFMEIMVGTVRGL